MNKPPLAPVMLNQLARYDFALPLIETVGPETVLEVGSGSEGLHRFSGTRYRITVTDLDFTDYGTTDLEVDGDGPERVQADVSDLPFADRQFDVVLALDLIEHVPPEKRERALSEIARVAGRRAIVGCPAGSEALEADRKLAAVYDVLPGRTRPVWLEEHLTNGFPEASDLSVVLSRYGRVALLPNERLGHHLAVSILEATPLVVRLTLGLARKLAPDVGSDARAPSWRSRLLGALRGHDESPSYRTFAVLDRD